MSQQHALCQHYSIPTLPPCTTRPFRPACRRIASGLYRSHTCSGKDKLNMRNQIRCSGVQQGRAEPSDIDWSSAVYAGTGNAHQTDARVAVEGDTVTVRYQCRRPDGEGMGVSEENDTVTFEVGAGEVMGNKLFQVFDAGIRGLQIGEKNYLHLSGGEWNEDFVFSVPIEHEEMQRLARRYKNDSGIKEGMVAELSNGCPAMVLAVKGGEVMIDCNNMMAGQKLFFELELTNIERGK